MADNSSKDRGVPRDNVPRVDITERGEQTGMLDVPQEFAGDDKARFEDRMQARQSIAMRHIIPDEAADAGQSAQRELDEAMGSTEGVDQLPAKSAVAGRSVSILRKRFGKFKSLKRGYYSFVLLSVLYILSFFLPVLVNNKAIMVRYNGDTYFPAILDVLPGTDSFYPGTTFGQAENSGEVNYRRLDEKFEAEGGDNFVLLPPYTWNPLENDFESTVDNPQPPSKAHVFGTDDLGRDVFARMVYGFNISISFALLLVGFEYLIGAMIGGLMGFYGGKVDLIGQRFIEIWNNIPFLFTVIIIGSIVMPSFAMLVFILTAFGWISISFYMRGEFYREKSKDYVAAAIALGTPDRQIIFRHILPNALTPMIAFLPFYVVGGITTLVSLDFLGFGLQPPTPSWGQMMDVGRQNLEKWWLIVTPISALFMTLLLVTFIGEAVREAFDPRTYSRLR